VTRSVAAGHHKSRNPAAARFRVGSTSSSPSHRAGCACPSDLVSWSIELSPAPFPHGDRGAGYRHGASARHTTAIPEVPIADFFMSPAGRASPRSALYSACLGRYVVPLFRGGSGLSVPSAGARHPRSTHKLTSIVWLAATMILLQLVQLSGRWRLLVLGIANAPRNLTFPRLPANVLAFRLARDMAGFCSARRRWPRKRVPPRAKHRRYRSCLPLDPPILFLRSWRTPRPFVIVPAAHEACRRSFFVDPRCAPARSPQAARLAIRRGDSRRGLRPRSGLDPAVRNAGSR